MRQASITSVEVFESDMIRHKVPLGRGGFANPRLRDQHKYAWLMCTAVFDDEDEAITNSQLAQLNTAGHLAHLK